MIIECCGAPGAGKTTIARELVEALSASGVPASLSLEDVSARRPARARLVRKLRMGGMELIRHPASSFRILLGVAQARQKAGRDVIARSLNLLVLRSALRKARSTEGVHIFDQGIIQELASIGYAARLVPDIAMGDPGHGGLAPDLILAIDVDVKTANIRLAGRPGQESRVEAAGVDQATEITKQKALIDLLLKAWLERYAHRMPSTLFYVDNRDGAPVLDDLINTIKALMMHERDVA